MDALAALESLLCERYNLRQPDSSAVFAAIGLVREEGASALPLLEAEMEGRELYRWAHPVAAAMNEVREGLAHSPAPAPAKPKKPTRNQPR